MGPGHQSFLPPAKMIGGILLFIAVTIVQTPTQPGCLPAGVVVAIIGAPYFLYLMYLVRRL
ncbi:iron chelate uptake ABC transporter family permease subunit [Staphylococcus chromogenes]